MTRISNKIDPNLQYSEASREKEGVKERLLALRKTDGGEHGTGKGPIETNLTSHVLTRNPLKTHFIQGVVVKNDFKLVFDMVSLGKYGGTKKKIERLA